MTIETKVTLRPLDDRIVVKKLPMEEGILVMPDQIKDRSQLGEVLRVGSGRRDEHGHRHAPEVQVGEKVFYAHHSPTTMKVDGEDYLVLNEQQILATVDPDTGRLVPYADTLIVERIVKDKIGLLYLPDQSQDKTECRVLAVGKGARHKNGPDRHPLETKPGDHVYLKMWSGWEIPNIKETRLVKEEVVYVVIEREEDGQPDTSMEAS